MTELLALKYRPKTFQDVIGQRVSALVLDRMVQQGTVPQGLLFSGSRGSGKTSMARILARSLDAGDLIEVDAASHGGVSDVREMIESLRYSTNSEYRVVLYDEAHSMSRDAFNALLKTLEEPPSGTIFILVTTEPNKIPETVKSRLMEFSFRKVSADDIHARLRMIIENEKIRVSSDLVRYIADNADGSVRDAIMMLDQCHRARVEDLDEFLKMTGDGDVAPHLVMAMLSANHSHIFRVADDLRQRVTDPSRMISSIVQVLKDVLILHSRGTLDLSEDSVAIRKELAYYLEPARVVAGLRVMWDLKTRVRDSVDPRGNLDLVLVLVSDIFTQGREPVQPKRDPKRSEQTLTMEDL